jgi:hypothetical protein
MVKKYSFGPAFILALWALYLQSCNLINPPETIPGYGHIDSIGVSTTYATQGTASSKISCAWVYVDDQPVGAFDMPCTFPIIATNGVHTITIYPGVTADGASSTREKYLFYNFYSGYINITQGSVTKVQFNTQYRSSVQFDWKEDFEEPDTNVISLTRYPIGTDSVLMRKVKSPNAFQGTYSGEVDLDSAKAMDSVMIYEAYTDTMSLPHDGSSVFIEMNYKTNTPFGVGISPGFTFYTEPVFAFVLPGNGWQKIYIDITLALNNSQTPLFRIFFSMNRTRGVQAQLLLDNIKVLHLKGS